VDDFSEGSLSIGALASPSLGPLFWRPKRLGVDSAWYGHLPFAQWIVFATRPRVLVELGTHAGVSYSAFCEAVAHAELDTRCFAVDTWAGDEHAGFYGENIFQDLKQFHDERYAAFSQMIRRTFDEALAYLPDHSIDLLHIDGRHHYEDVRHDFETWLPKLSDRAVVLFHDTNVRERDFGVWRLWHELAGQHPSFEFLHAYGLGVLIVGRQAPDMVKALCRLEDPADIAAVRHRFAALGERWICDIRLRTAERELKTALQLEREVRAWGDAESAFGKTAHAELMALTSRYTALETAYLQLKAERNSHIIELAEARSARDASERASRQQADEATASYGLAIDALRAERDSLATSLADAMQNAAAAQATISSLIQERAIVMNSTSWRLTAPIRRIVSRLRPSRPLPPAPAAPPAEPVVALAEPAPIISVPSPPPSGKPRILYIAGEPDTPGATYRCDRYEAACCLAGWEATTVAIKDVTDKTLLGHDVVVLWRAAWDGHVEQIIACARGNGSRVVFDVDDLMIKPELAKIAIVDGIRTIQVTESDAQYFFGRVQRVLANADVCSCTTSELARHLREWQKATHVLPNGFDAEALRRSRLAVRQAKQAEGDGLIRLGYAAGTRTHQKDFRQAAGAVARVLAARPDTRLVLFRATTDGQGVVLAEEFDELAPYQDRIEWRAMVPLIDLPDELIRFDINLAPLEVENPFCEAKSELKYFEAALVDVPTVASPTGPYRRAIDDGRTGFLAAGEDEWYARMLQLVDDPELRRQVGRAAFHDALWTFGPQRRLELTRSFLHQLNGGVTGAQAFELAVRRGEYRATTSPNVPQSDILFATDRLLDAQVTVTIASYNYAEYVVEALESVRMQTLELLDLVVVDDCSPDPTVPELILAWAKLHAARFNRLVVRRHQRNAGLGATRNSGFDTAETPYVLPLDADNRLHPHCCERLLAALLPSNAAYVYPRMQEFGSRHEVAGGERFEPMRFVGGNYIDAMALVGKWAWAAAGGYDTPEFMGWEDYGLWCQMIEIGQWGQPVEEILAEYRVHHDSMVNEITETQHNKMRLVANVERRHPWLDILVRGPKERALPRTS
jgi:glycosyltransferase involved in cell wall biosynthesis